MPLLPLPVGGAAIDGGDLPVVDSGDVVVEFPKTHRRPPVAPVRDAFCAGFAEGFVKYQDVAAYAAGQSDPIRSTGDYLKAYAEEHSVIPGVDETEESVHERMFQAPDIVTPDAIIAGINAIIAPDTCTLSELELDGLFIHQGISEWDSFIGTDPEYPDRYYAEAPERLPGGAIPSRGYPRSMAIRIPIIAGDSADALYAQVVAFVQSIKGQGISWSLVVGPN